MQPCNLYESLVSSCCHMHLDGLSSLWPLPAVPGFPNSLGDPARAGGGHMKNREGGSAALVLRAVLSPCPGAGDGGAAGNGFSVSTNTSKGRSKEGLGCNR